MSKYVKNCDLTVEYIVMRAWRLGATQVYQDTRHEHHRQIVTVWPSGEVVCYPMEDYLLPSGWNMNFARNLVSLRRCIEDQGYNLKLEREHNLKVEREREQRYRPMNHPIECCCNLCFQD